ncbi:neutral/alkaline non-lysosomal ceramidase N-terminal domain-containing protein [Kitasatospora sp. NPDC048365]|uniref:neutral/alkaline non-lysosomal ceramidase N-terminal domain-containing protein n=1 Tax=Kitasatospora sp. NPDC048365 TaxID=3364050 RepID=UPI003716694F
MEPPSFTRRRGLQLAAAAAGSLALGTGRATAADTPTPPPSPYLVGRGIADITGAAAESGMMGYSIPDQQTAGIHQRLRARAFVIVDPASGNRIAWCNTDQGILPFAVFQAVIARLTALYGGTYTEQNVSVSATHTHSGPGGCAHDLAYNLSIGGFQQQNFDAVVSGVVEAIAAAHADLCPSTITLGRGELTDASVNRSRPAFELNPQADKDVYPLGIDPTMTVLRFRQGTTDVGAISWFPTHGTSITNTNTLISGDNKGYAAYAWEHDTAGVRYLDGSPAFVAAFPQTNSGDMSPNLNLEPGSGPTDDEFENTRIIGLRQATAAQQIHADATVPISGGINSLLRFVDMSQVRIDGRYTPDGQIHHTSSGVIGLSTLAGSLEDGPGIPGVIEGTPSPLAPLIAELDAAVPQWLADEQSPKTCVVPGGLLQATPNVIPLQLVKIGQLYLIGGPAEYTIVSGLRIRRAVAEELGVPLENVIMQGYTNGYSQYVTTPEEYDGQQYEGASTLFGRYTAPAYQQEFAKLASALRAGNALPLGDPPPETAIGTLNVQTGVVLDSPGMLRTFGQVITDAAAGYQRGQQVSVVFVTGHPKNNLHRGSTFLEVQRAHGDTWTRCLDDGDWQTKYRWQRTNTVTGESTATITWDIAPDTPPGTYRIVHNGDAKNGLTGQINAFTGASRPFTVS